MHGEFSIGRRPEGGTIIEVNVPVPRQRDAESADPQVVQTP